MLALKWPEQLFAEAEWSSRKKAMGSSFDIAVFLSEPLCPVCLVQKHRSPILCHLRKASILVLFLNQERGEEVLPRPSMAIPELSVDDHGIKIRSPSD